MERGQFEHNKANSNLEMAEGNNSTRDSNLGNTEKERNEYIGTVDMVDSPNERAEQRKREQQPSISNSQFQVIETSVEGFIT